MECLFGEMEMDEDGVGKKEFVGKKGCYIEGLDVPRCRVNWQPVQRLQVEAGLARFSEAATTASV